MEVKSLGVEKWQKLLKQKNELIFSLFTKASNESLISLGLVQRLLNWRLLSSRRRKVILEYFFSFSVMFLTSNIEATVLTYEINFKLKNLSYFDLNISSFLVINIFWSKIVNLDYIMPSDAMFSQKCNENCFTWECGKHETFQLNLDKNMLFSAPPCIISRARTQKQSETGPFQCDGKDLYSRSSYINLKIKLFYLFCSSSFLIYNSFFLQMAHLYIIFRNLKLFYSM